MTLRLRRPTLDAPTLRAAALLLAFAIVSPALGGATTTESAAAAGGGDLTAEAVVARYVAARGGAEAWSGVRTLELRGTYAAFSKRSDFTLLRRRGDGGADLYRLDFQLLDAPAVRARDAEGVWLRHALLQAEAGRPGEELAAYRPQLERESRLLPLLLDPAAAGAEVELLGPGEVDGVPTVDLRLTLADGAQETWHLDPESWLEVAVDREVVDYTQALEPVAQRTFFADFRTVDGGIVIPFRVDQEFGARLEAMTVEEVLVNGAIDEERFAPPPARAPGR